MKCSAEVKKVVGSDKVKGYAQVTIDDCFVIKNIRVLEGKNGLFVSMPSYKTKKVDETGNVIWQDYAYPITKESREQIVTLILRSFESGKEENVGTAGELGFEASIYKNTDEESSCVAFVSCTLGGAVAVRGIKIMKGKEGNFLVMPSVASGKVNAEGYPIYREIAHPITKEFRAKLYDTILSGLA